MPFKRSLTVFSLAAVVALAGCTGGGDPDAAGEPAAEAGAEAAVPEADVAGLPEVVAEVDGEQISREEFVQTYEGQYQQAVMAQQGEVDQGELKLQTVELLINDRLLLGAAVDAGIEASDAEVDAVLGELAAQSGLGSADELVAALEQQGMGEDEIRADAAARFQVTEYLQREADVPEPSEEQLRQQYDALVAQQEAAGQDAASEQSAIPPFEEVREQLAQQATAQQQGLAAQQIVDGLRQSADVTVHL